MRLEILALAFAPKASLGEHDCVQRPTIPEEMPSALANHWFQARWPAYPGMDAPNVGHATCAVAAACRSAQSVVATTTPAQDVKSVERRTGCANPIKDHSE